MIEDSDVGIHVVEIVGVWRVVSITPLLRSGNINIKHGVLRLGLVIHRVKPDDILQKAVQLRVGGGVDGGLEQRPEQVLQNLLEAGDVVVALVDVKQSGNLHEDMIILHSDWLIFKM